MAGMILPAVYSSKPTFRPCSASWTETFFPMMGSRTPPVAFQPPSGVHEISACVDVLESSIIKLRII